MISKFLYFNTSFSTHFYGLLIYLIILVIWNFMFELDYFDVSPNFMQTLASFAKHCMLQLCGGRAPFLDFGLILRRSFFFVSEFSLVFVCYWCSVAAWEQSSSSFKEYFPRKVRDSIPLYSKVKINAGKIYYFLSLFSSCSWNCLICLISKPEEFASLLNCLGPCWLGVCFIFLPLIFFSHCLI